MPTDPNRVKKIFHEAAERRGQAARIAYLDLACGGDPELRNRVEALLRSHDKEGTFLDAPAAGPTLPDSACEVTLERTPSSESEVTLERPPTGDCDVSPVAHDDEEPEGLEFLTPSTRPDSLGRIGHYEVLEVLGKGGFGIVFRAFDETLHRVVAVKVLAPQLAATSPARKRFLREARSSAKVRHENIVQVYAVEEQPLPYLVMEFIPGETLQQRIDRTGPIETSELLQLGRQIAEGLAAAHAQGLIHRDIKPGNILIEAGANPHAKITDFGLARAADDASLTQSGTVAGTPMYMAPEQAHGDALDHRTDLFSLGSVLYKMCTGRAPFRANSTLAVLKRVVEDTPRPIREIIPEVPHWLCDIITRLHAKKPDDRIGSAREVADLLGRGLATMQGLANPSSFPVVASVAAGALPLDTRKALAKTLEIPKPTPEPTPQRRHRLWAAAAAVSLLLLGSLGIAEANGVTNVRGTVIRLFSPEGTVVVEVDDPDVSVKIDGSDIVITGAGAREIRLKPGSYTVEATKDGKMVSRELVNVTRNGRQVVRVSREPTPADAAVARPVAVARSTKAARPVKAPTAWERSVAARPAAEQVKAVAARMKELNPGFDGMILPIFDHGAVTGLEFKSDDVTDISPIRALTKLTSLRCGGTEPQKGRITDLSPLQGLRLTSLDVSQCPVSDLSPLEGMPLTEFWCVETRVNDLSPLKGMKLQYLNCMKTEVNDLTPLKGMPLEVLHLHKTKVALLTGLEGTELRELMIDNTKVFDLSPLKGLPLTTIDAASTPISDLSPVKGMKLTYFNCGSTFVSDLSPLAGMPLRCVVCAASRVTDEGVAALEDCEDLEELAINHTRVTDAGLMHLKGLKKLRLLDMMDIKATDLTPLEDLSFERIRLTPRRLSLKGLNLLRDMDVKTIGTDWNQALPADEFWARFDKGEFR